MHNARPLLGQLQHQTHRLLSTLVLIGLAGLLPAQAAWALQNELTAVSIAQGAGDNQVIRIQLKQGLENDPMVFTTTNPNRLVIDFLDTTTGLARGAQKAETGAIRDYQAVQFGNRTRLVVNLVGPFKHDLRRDKNTVYAVIKNAAKLPQSTLFEPEYAPVAASMPALPAQSVQDIEFQRGNHGESRIVTTLSNPGVGIDIQQKGAQVQVDFLNTALPAALQRRMDVTEFATPAEFIDFLAQNSNARMRVSSKGKWDYYAYQSGNKFFLDIRPQDADSKFKGKETLFSGEKITLNFQKVPVRDVLHVIADSTDFNIALSDAVKGETTLRLKDVPRDQALDVIMRLHDLDKRVVGNVIWIEPRAELAKKEEDRLKARKDAADLEGLVTRSYALKFVRADDAMVVMAGGSLSQSSTPDATCSPSSTGIKTETATGAASSGSGGQSSSNTSSGQNSSSSTTTHASRRVLSERGGASHELTTNTLIVTDIPEKHLAVEEVLKQIDVAKKQVMIEARIVVADDQFGRDLGARLGIHNKTLINGNAIGISSGAGTSAGIAAGTSTVSGQSGYNVQLPNGGVTNAGTLGFTILNAAANTMLSLELQALETDKRGKIISNPRVVTTNLRPAVILQGTQIPYQNTSSTSGTTTEFRDALLCLLVSPQILNNDSIILNVEVTKDAQGESTTAGPAINVNRVNTQVRVKNGETAILGGIFEQVTRDDTSKVPLLGDLPVVGHLFKTNSRSDKKNEMLIFITPKLLDERLSGAAQF